MLRKKKKKYKNKDNNLRFSIAPRISVICVFNNDKPRVASECIAIGGAAIKAASAS